MALSSTRATMLGRALVLMCCLLELCGGADSSSASGNKSKFRRGKRQAKFPQYPYDERREGPNPGYLMGDLYESFMDEIEMLHGMLGKVHEDIILCEIREHQFSESLTQCTDDKGRLQKSLDTVVKELRDATRALQEQRQAFQRDSAAHQNAYAAFDSTLNNNDNTTYNISIEEVQAWKENSTEPRFQLGGNSGNMTIPYNTTSDNYNTNSTVVEPTTVPPTTSDDINNSSSSTSSVVKTTQNPLQLLIQNLRRKALANKASRRNQPNPADEN